MACTHAHALVLSLVDTPENREYADLHDMVVVFPAEPPPEVASRSKCHQHGGEVWLTHHDRELYAGVKMSGLRVMILCHICAVLAQRL